MNLTLSEEQDAIIEMAKKYAESELAPVAARLDVGANKEADRTLFLKNLQGLAELGFMGMNVKAEYQYGGGGDSIHCQRGTEGYLFAEAVFW
jgi:alkylation response protein AidB-like acyl-CoA dehydrogenase